MDFILPDEDLVFHINDPFGTVHLKEGRHSEILTPVNPS
jgi:hypothetical protein